MQSITILWTSYAAVPHLEAGSLTSSRLLLYGHDLEDFILKCRPEEVVYDLALLCPTKKKHFRIKVGGYKTK